MSLYQKIQKYILRKIASGEYKEGMQIPTEMELATLFNVSRMTANRAIVELSQQKLLKRIPGKGTFVAAKKAEAPPLQVTDIADEIKSRGHEHTWELLEQRAKQAPFIPAKYLEVPLDTTIYYCKLLHFEDNMPIALENRYVTPQLVPDFFEQDYLKVTPSGFLLRKYILTEMEHSIEAISASEEMTKTLMVERDSPCLFISRRSWNEQGVITYVEFTFPAERYKLHSRQKVMV